MWCPGWVCLLAALTPAAGQVQVPGGLKALAFMAHGKRNSPPERFLVDYCRAIVNGTEVAEKKAAAEYVRAIRDYFALVGELSRLGRAEGDRVTVTLLPRRDTERVASLLGWKFRQSSGEVLLEPAEKRSQARCHEATSALAIDEVALQETLQAGKPFRFQIVHERAAILLGENTWRAAFYPKETPPGGFAEVLARGPRLAKLYLGLSATDGETRSLLASMGLKELAENFAELVHRYSSALTMSGGAMVVPGGEAAEPVWASLAGASPRHPAQFVRALLEKDQGRLLAWFFAVSELDAARQRFFSASAARAAGFYAAFRDAPEFKPGVKELLRGGSLLDFLREVALDREGRVRFPGGLGVWAEDSSESEDTVLLRLARARYMLQTELRTGLDQFLAVARIEARRPQPLDAASAKLLARHHSRCQSVYPYFEILTALGEPDFAQFFAFAGKMQRLGAAELNNALGQWHALVELLSLAQQSGALSPEQAAALFRRVCERFAGAASAAEFTAASLDIAAELLGAEPDEAVRRLLLGPASAPTAFTLNGVSHEIDAAKARHANYQRVLAAQKVPPLAALVRARAAAAAGELDALEANLARVPYVDTPKAGATPRTRAMLASFQPQRLRRVLDGMRKGRNPRREAELLAELAAPVRWALSGVFYAAFLNADDLLVAEDPLFLRKHKFFDARPMKRDGLFPASELRNVSASYGSTLVGGFADFSSAAGQVAAVGGRLAEASPTAAAASQPVASAQLGCLRTTDYHALDEDSLRRFGLAVGMAREWIVEAGRQPALRAGLGEGTLGLLSLSRRRELLDGVAARDWDTVWASVTLSDLYYLGRRYLERYATDPWPSEAAAALRKAGPLEPSPERLLKCRHPQLAEPAPYEEFERYLFPARMAERLCELKLYLADFLVSKKLPAQALGAIAEPAAREIFRKLHMTDLRDWHSVLASFASVNEPLIEGVLPQ